MLAEAQKQEGGAGFHIEQRANVWVRAAPDVISKPSLIQVEFTKVKEIYVCCIDSYVPVESSAAPNCECLSV